MNRMRKVVFFLWLAVPCCVAQVAPPAKPLAPPPSAGANPRVVAHGAFPVKVTRTLDSSKLRQGDRIEAETAGAFRLPDGTLVPKGSKLTGHVTVAKARSKGDKQSELGIVFDAVRLENDGTMVLRTIVQALYPPKEETDPGVVNGYTMSKDGAPGYLPPDVQIGSNSEVPAKSQPVVDLKYIGVQGMNDLALNKDGLISSPEGRSVKLGKGVRMVVHVDVFG